MNDKNELISSQIITNCIYTIRGKQVMLDRDLAELYKVETKVLNQAVKRNIERFPTDFMFQLSKEDFSNWRSQFVTSNNDKMGLRRPPYAFTEQGVSMLSAVLKSHVAVNISVQIIRAFVEMRKFLINNASLFQRLEKVEYKQIETDKKIDKIFDALQSKELTPNQGIFFDGQVFDAYTLMADLVRSAKKSIVLIDNYIDDTVLTHLCKKKSKVNVTLFTKTISKQLQLDVQKANTQYPNIQAKVFTQAHDRFLIIDQKTVYHLGASLKDLGKKWFAFSKLNKDSVTIINSILEMI